VEHLAYTDADVASMLRVSKRTVYRLRKSGALQAVRIGRAVRVPADSLAHFLERLATPSSSIEAAEARHEQTATNQ
jgi:excisionase family DNA binding protein